MNGIIEADGVLVGEGAELLSMGWASVLTDGMVLHLVHHVELNVNKWSVRVGAVTFHGLTVVEAELGAWRDFHESHGIEMASLSGSAILVCPDCGDGTVLGSFGAATGFWRCSHPKCDWSELGTLTTCWNHVVGLPWPKGVLLIDETVDEKKGVTLASYPAGEDDMRVTRPTFEEAESALFEECLRRRGDV